MSIETISRSVMSVRNSTYGAGDVIDVLITPEECSMLNSSETTIRFVINMTAPQGQEATNCLSQLDGYAGGYSVFDTVQIFSGSDQNTLLEQLDNVNDFMALYQHYSQTPGMNNFWTLTCGKCPNNSNNSLYYNQVGANANFVPIPVECVMKLPMSGILGGDGKLFPCVLTGGLRIRIQLSQVNKSVSVALPATGRPNPRAALPAAANINDINCYRLSTALQAANTTQINIADAGGFQDVGDTNSCRIKVGQEVKYVNDAGLILSAGLVQSIAYDAGGVCQITVPQFAATVAAAGSKVFIEQDSLNASWTMSNFEILTSVAEPDPATLKSMMEKAQAEGGLAVDYVSYNLIRDNINRKISNPQINVLTSEKRALSILQTPINPDYILAESAFSPVGDQALFYQYNISNRLTPNRQVPIDRVAGATPLQFNAVHGSELEKALDRGGIPPRFQSNNNAFFTIGRALSREGHSFDANNHNIKLNLTYSTGNDANDINKLLLTQVRHIRRAIITPESVSVDF